MVVRVCIVIKRTPSCTDPLCTGAETLQTRADVSKKHNWLLLLLQLRWFANQLATHRIGLYYYVSVPGPRKDVDNNNNVKADQHGEQSCLVWKHTRLVSLHVSDGFASLCVPSPLLIGFHSSQCVCWHWMRMRMRHVSKLSQLRWPGAPRRKYTGLLSLPDAQRINSAQTRPRETEGRMQNQNKASGLFKNKTNQKLGER